MSPHISITPDPARAVKTTRLPNGVHILSLSRPGAHSAALGIWLLNGARHEAPGRAGYAHLLEHLWLRQSGRLDGRSLARRFEAMGGRINAHTGRELSALHGLVTRDDVGELIDLFLETLLAPRWDDHDVAVERDVVLQEMAMAQEDAADALEEYAIGRVWPAHPMGEPILGRREAVQAASAEALKSYRAQVLTGARLWVAAVGAVEHQALVDACAALAALPHGAAPIEPPPRFSAFRSIERRAVSQSHLLWVLPAPGAVGTDYYAWLLADHLMGGGISSRLFQALRERQGLAYAVESRLETYSDTGLWWIRTVCEPRHSQDCRAAVEHCVRSLINAGPEPEEMAVSRRHLVAELLITQDDSEACMERLAREAIYLGRHPELAERVQRLASVTPGEIATVLGRAWQEAAFFEWSP